MHDPSTQAFVIYLGKKTNRKSHYKTPLITIWHKDPCKDGTDDSCGWFMRSRHGNADMRNKIKSAIGFQFDSTFKSDSGTTYYTGYFIPSSGLPNMSVSGIVLDIFSRAAWEFFEHDRKKQKRWMKENLYDILHFAENTTDSLRDEVLGTFRIGTNSAWNREDSLNHYTSVIYGWLLRSNRKWYQHPKWHIRHWSIQFHPWQRFIRRYITKCSICGKRGFKGSAHSDWYGTKIWHSECDQGGKPKETVN